MACDGVVGYVASLDINPKAPDLERRYRESGWWNDDTLADLLAAAAATVPRKLAIRSAEGELTYAEWHDRARRLASSLSSLGVGTGDVVAVQLPNTPAFLVSFAAISALGGIMQPLPMPYRDAELRALLGHGGARCFIAASGSDPDSPARQGVRLAGDIDTLAHVVAVGPAQEGAHSWADLLHAESSAPLSALPALTGDDPFLLLYTSGTTGNPKGVPIRYAWFMSNARIAATDWALTSEDVLLSVAPLTHLYGLWTIILTLYCKATSALLEAFTPPGLVDCVATHRPTVVFAVPAHVGAMIQSGAWDQLDPSGIRIMCQAGSIVPRPIAVAIEDKLGDGCVVQLFGMSELQAGSYTRPGNPAEIRVGTSGAPPAGMELRIVDDDNHERPPGEEGHLQFRGIAVFTGYLDNPGATREAFTDDGWFRTGDTALLTVQGRLRITGRAKELVNRGGVKYHPADVEDIVNQLPAVQSSAVVSYPDEVLGERACVFIELAPGASVTLGEVTAALERAGLAKFKWPERLELVDAMPLTPTRKVIRGRRQALL